MPDSLREPVCSEMRSDNTWASVTLGWVAMDADNRVPSRRGRPFIVGNPGRKRGSKNRASLVAAGLLEGERDKLLRVAITKAERGSDIMLKFLLERSLPRERLLKISLPQMGYADDAVASLTAILGAVCEGKLRRQKVRASVMLLSV